MQLYTYPTKFECRFGATACVVRRAALEGPRAKNRWANASCRATPAGKSRRRTRSASHRMAGRTGGPAATASRGLRVAAARPSSPRQ